MPYIGKNPVGGGFHKLDALTASATATYALTLNSAAYYPESANQLLVSLNGVIQAPQDSFTVSGSNLVFDTALTASDSIDFVVALGDVLAVQTVTDGAITTAKLGNNAVTSAKLDTNIDIAGTLDVTGALTVDSGIYLGGTGSANYLDDYEEGTFTPYYEPASGSFSSITYDTVTNGFYTKIGERVFIEGRIRTDALTVGTASGALYLSGLPFASNIQAGAISVGYTATWAGNSARMGYFNSDARVYLNDTPTSTANAGTLFVTDMATGANSNYMYFSGHYRTSA